MGWSLAIGLILLRTGVGRANTQQPTRLESSDPELSQLGRKWPGKDEAPFIPFLEAQKPLTSSATDDSLRIEEEFGQEESFQQARQWDGQIALAPPPTAQPNLDEYQIDTPPAPRGWNIDPQPYEISDSIPEVDWRAAPDDGDACSECCRKDVTGDKKAEYWAVGSMRCLGSARTRTYLQCVVKTEQGRRKGRWLRKQFPERSRCGVMADTVEGMGTRSDPYWQSVEKISVDDPKPAQQGCLAGQHGCSAFATCILDSSMKPKCTCKSGYLGDGQNCIPGKNLPSGERTQAPVPTQGGGKPTQTQEATRTPSPSEDLQCDPNSNSCDDNAACYVDSKDPSPERYTCKCNPGYNGDGYTCEKDQRCSGGYVWRGGKCVDLDECSERRYNDCSPHALCTNMPGDYDCQCLPGWDGPGHECVDVDECARGTHTCSKNAKCTNIKGSYKCACNKGYTGNGLNCVAENGTPCPGGYKLQGGECVDIDECSGVDDAKLCGEGGSCQNTKGSYTCTCPNGYKLKYGKCVFFGDGLKTPETQTENPAQHSDYCSEAARAICEERKAWCVVNSSGAAGCRCMGGYVAQKNGDGMRRFCVNDDECATGTHRCDPVGGKCVDTIGSYTCGCVVGFEGNGLTCTPLENTPTVQEVPTPTPGPATSTPLPTTITTPPPPHPKTTTTTTTTTTKPPPQPPTTKTTTTTTKTTTTTPPPITTPPPPPPSTTTTTTTTKTTTKRPPPPTTTTTTSVPTDSTDEEFPDLESEIDSSTPTTTTITSNRNPPTPPIPSVTNITTRTEPRTTTTITPTTTTTTTTTTTATTTTTTATTTTTTQSVIAATTSGFEIQSGKSKNCRIDFDSAYKDLGLRGDPNSFYDKYGVTFGNATLYGLVNTGTDMENWSLNKDGTVWGLWDVAHSISFKEPVRGVSLDFIAPNTAIIDVTATAFLNGKSVAVVTGATDEKEIHVILNFNDQLDRIAWADVGVGGDGGYGLDNVRYTTTSPNLDCPP